MVGRGESNFTIEKATEKVIEWEGSDNLRFNHIYSMTNSIEVASNFSVNNGILLKLKSYRDPRSQNNKTYNYFNLNLISSYTNEYEKLFIGYDNDNVQLQIYDK